MSNDVAIAEKRAALAELLAQREAWAKGSGATNGATYARMRQAIHLAEAELDALGQPAHTAG